MLHELVFDIVLRPASVMNQALYAFSKERPTFCRRIEDVRFTEDHAWLTTLVDGTESDVEAYASRFAAGSFPYTEDVRLVARGPRFRLYHEKVRAPRPPEEETVWHLVAKHVGTDARVTYVTREGASRVTVVHDDRKRLLGFLERALAQDAHKEMKFVRIAERASRVTAPLRDAERRLLEDAWRAGYYEVPRRITLRELASKLELPTTTLGYRLRKAEAETLRSLLFQGETPLR